MKIWSRYLISIAFLSRLVFIAAALAEDSSVPSYYNRSAIVRTRQLYQYEVWLGDKEVCKNDHGQNGYTSTSYGQCNANFFPSCPDGYDLCFHRKMRTDKFVNGNTDDPYYYIQYNKIVCRPAPLKKGDLYDCSSCTPGEYCPTLQRCVWKVWKYCPDDPNYITCQKTNCAPERKWLKKMERRKRLGFIDEIPGT